MRAKVPFFSVRPWENIALADELESLSPVTRMQVRRKLCKAIVRELRHM